MARVSGRRQSSAWVVLSAWLLGGAGGVAERRVSTARPHAPGAVRERPAPLAQLGPFGDMAPTGKRIDIDVLDLFQIRDGVLIEHWALLDNLGMMKQLGAIA